MSRIRNTGLFLLLAAMWGSSFVAVRAALPYIPPVPLAAFRFDIAGLFMLGYAAITTTHWVPRTRSEWLSVISGSVVFIAAHHAFLFVGQQYVTSAIAAIIISLDPILATGFSRVLLPDERLNPLGIVGLGLGFLGVGIVANPTPQRLLSPDIIGVVFIFLAAATFALGAVLTRRYRTDADMPVRSLQAWMMLLGAPLLHLVTPILPVEGLSVVQWTPTAVVSLAYLAFITAGIGYLIYFYLLDQLGPIEINLVGYVAPIFAALIGWLVLGEQITARTVIGFLVIVCGFVLVKWEAITDELTSDREAVS